MYTQTELFSDIGLTLSTLGTGALIGGILTSWASGSIQPLTVGSAIVSLATLIGFVTGFVLQKLRYLPKDHPAQGLYSMFSSYITYITLTTASMGAGIIPGSMIGIAATIAAVVIGVLLIPPYTRWQRYCC